MEKILEAPFTAFKNLLPLFHFKSFRKHINHHFFILLNILVNKSKLFFFKEIDKKLL